MTNYPAKIDTDVELPGVIDGVTENSAEIINSIREAVVAIETVIGIDPQGSQTDLATRIANALNVDGTIKSTALPSTLVDLPITNTQVGASAAIEESKLDLDVATQTLQDQITSNDVDIAELQDDLASLLTRYLRHVAGTGDRHPSDQIDHTLADGYLSGSGTTVKAALDFTFGELQAHKTATTIREHLAAAIEYVPRTVAAGEVAVIESNNVQDAITDVELEFLEDRRKHNDSAHADGISNDGYVFLGGQAAVNDASLKLTRYQPNSGTDIIQIGLCNAASVKTKGFTPTEIDSSANSIDIQMNIGTATRTLSVTGLEGAEYPAGNSRVTLQGIIDFLNAAFANTVTPAHFPVSAYASEDGELVLQHNLARDDATITIKDPGANSAISALGFTEIVDIEISRVENWRFTINGTPFTELATLVDSNSSQSTLSTVVDLGQTVDSSGLNLRANQLIHIYNHSTGSANGTYKIVGLNSATEVQLAEDLSVGTFNFVIYKDSFNTNNITSNRRVLDFYLDSSRNPLASERSTVVFGGVEGIRLVEVSQGFESFTGEFQVRTSGSQISMRLEDSDGYQGVETLFDPGFIGYLQVYGPDNVSSVTAFVFDINPTSGSTINDTVTIIDSEFQDDRILLGTSHHNGLSVIELPLNRRNVGLVGNSSIGTEFRRDIIERNIDNFHLSGIVRGFDITQVVGSQVRVRGGTAYVNGKLVEKPSQLVEVINVASSDGTWNLVLSKEGNFEILEDSESPLATAFSVADLIKASNPILIARVTVASGVITDTSDARLFVNDIESKLQLTVDARDLGSGTFRTLESAVLYSENAPFDTQPEITILSDLTISDALTIGANSRIVAFGNITLSGALTLSASAEFKIFGTLTASSSVTISSGATLEVLGSSSFTSAITMSDDGNLTFGQNASLTGIDINGSRVKIAGTSDGKKPIISFDGTRIGINFAGSNDILITNLDFSMGISTNAIVFIGGATENADFVSCDFRQSTGLSTVQIAQTSRAAITWDSSVQSLLVRDGYFFNLGSGLNHQDGDTNDAIIDNCLFKNVGSCGIFQGANNVKWLNSTHKNLHTLGISMSNSITNSRNILISNNIFEDRFDVSSAPVVLTTSGTLTNQIINSNLIRNISTTKILDLDANYSGLAVTENLIETCTTTGFAVDISSATGGDRVFSNNIVREHTGPVAQLNLLIAANNYLEEPNSSTGTIMDFTDCVLDSNQLLASGSVASSLLLNNVIFSGNDVTVGRITVSGSTSSELTGNKFVLSDSTAANGITFNATGAELTFVGNRVNSSAASGVSSSALFFDNGSFVCANNSVSATAGLRAITDATALTDVGIIQGNRVKSGSTYGIFIDTDLALVEGNLVSGAVGAGGGDIVVAGGRTSIIVTGNFVNGSGGTERAFHTDPSPNSVYVSQNRGGLERRAYSVYTAFQQGTWTTTNNGTSSSTSGDKLFCPINNIPVGAKLESINIKVANVGTLGDANVQIFERSSTSTTGTSISSATDAPAGAFSTITVTPTSTTFIEDQKEYFIVVEMQASSSVDVGQWTANIRV